MARYELVEGTSAKFWEVDVSGNDMTVNFGRIGTAGQSKTKSFADAQAASKERDKLVKEKTGKGYSLAGTAATTAATASSAVASAVAAAVAPTARAAKSAAVKVPSMGNASVPGPVNAAVVAAGAPSRQSATMPDSSSASGPLEGSDAGVQSAAATPAIDWPRGGFQWKDEWRNELPVVRGIHAPPIEQGAASLAKLTVLPKDQHGWRAQQLGALAAAAGTSWTYWDEDLSRTRITEEAIAARDFDYWLELMAQAHVNVPYFVDWVVRRCVALHGLPFALKVVLALYELLPAISGWYYGVPGELSLMRHFLACADAAAYEEAVGAATMLRQSSDKARLACSSMFPDVSAWAVECIELNIADAQGLMRDCVLPAPVFAQYVKRHNPYLQSVRSALYLQIHLHGEAAFDALAVVLAQALGNKDATLHALELVTRMHVPELVPLLVRELESREVRGALDKLATQYPAAVLKCAIEHSLASRNRTVEGWTIRLALREKAALASALAAIDDMGRARFEATREVAAEYGDAMSAALQALLSADPLLVLPGKMPKLPSFFVAASFRRPELPGGEALPLVAMEHIASMLAISKLEAPYAGLDIVMQTCTPASLAEFAWDVFEAWIGAGAPSKEAWAFTALGLLGDDETARRLAPRIREWPGESAHARAVTGLDLLASIGSDVALMHLNGIAGKVKFKALQERAREKIATVAEARGFTPAELADRLVPDLGLDESGRLELNFGPRQFFVSFDEALKPFVKDAQGVRLKDLPKPIRSDDAALAEAASERYKQMKKDAKAIASLQITRLEMAMVARRRWPATDFKLFFIEHPLMRHLAARVIWGVYDNGSLTHNFRVAEDWTLADSNDNSYNLEDGASVGISHILEMPKASQEAFGQIFGDYEILQPFKQLGRETYSLTPEEQKLDTLTRFADKVVATGSVMGLVNRGWERGEAQDAGWVGEFIKQVGEDWQVDLQLDPGTVVGDMSYEPKQKLPTLTLR